MIVLSSLTNAQLMDPLCAEVTVNTSRCLQDPEHHTAPEPPERKQ